MATEAETNQIPIEDIKKYRDANIPIRPIKTDGTPTTLTLFSERQVNKILYNLPSTLRKWVCENDKIQPLKLLAAQPLSPKDFWTDIRIMHQNWNGIECQTGFHASLSCIVIGIDADDEKPKAILQRLITEYGLEGKTIIQKTPHNGLHLLVKIQCTTEDIETWLKRALYRNLCNDGCRIEIKTATMGITLSPSRHREDGLPYTHEGIIALAEVPLEFYFHLINELKSNGCIWQTPEEHAKLKDQQSNKQKQKKQSSWDLSKEMIQASVAYLTPYYLKGVRQDFAFHLSGTALHAKISEDSANEILSQIATNTNDEEIQKRLITLHETYEKGLNGTPITGGPTLAEVISAVKNCELEEGHRLVAILQSFWLEDIRMQQKKETVRNSKEIISVSEATNLIEGPVSVTGKIVVINAAWPMITKTNVHCKQCSNILQTLDCPRPIWKSLIKDSIKSCTNCQEKTPTNVKHEYIISREIQVQDIQKIDNTEQLTAILFGQNTEGIQFNDTVILRGNLHVVNKYDNQSNRLQSILFVESIEKQSIDEEIENTEVDVQEFVQFTKSFVGDEKSIIDELVSKTAPLTIANELAKKALLIVAVNAGLPNDKLRLPERIRTHVGLIGDPGLGKTKLLHQVADLVPGSRVESMQSSTGVSMTVYVDKEENGQRSIRPGPVVLANDAILGMNEFGQMKNIEDNKYFTDAAEEGSFTATKHGVNIRVIAHPSFIWTANPISGRWKNPDIIDAAEFPIIAQWGDRMDFVIPFIEKTDEPSIRDYLEQRRGLVNRLDSFTATTLWLKKYLLYARFLNPNLPETIRKKLEDYLVAIAKHGVRGLPRKIEALERTAIGFAKVKLKDSVDEEDVSDTINLFNEILKFYKQNIMSSRDMTFLACLSIYEKTTPTKRTLDDVIQEVCSKNEIIAQYIGKVRKSQYNHKIKDLKPLFNQHPNIRKCGDKPTVYVWVNEKNGNNNHIEQSSDVSAGQMTTDSCSKNLSDLSDVSAGQMTAQPENYSTQSTANNQPFPSSVIDNQLPPVSGDRGQIIEKQPPDSNGGIKKVASDTSDTSDKKLVEQKCRYGIKEGGSISTGNDFVAIQRLSQEGYTQRQITKTLDMSLGSVNRTLHKSITIDHHTSPQLTQAPIGIALSDLLTSSLQLTGNWKAVSPSTTDDSSELSPNSIGDNKEEDPPDRLVLKHSPHAIVFNNEEEFWERIGSKTGKENKG